MKKLTFVLIYLIFSVGIFAQHYNNNQLKVLATIWGETYLFHPSIIRSDKNIEWEKELVEFLPLLKKANTNEEFISIINSELLAQLQDPFTQVQTFHESGSRGDSNLASSQEFDYIKITAAQLSDISSLGALDILLNDPLSKKPLVLDLRIIKELEIDPHSHTFFYLLATMLIDHEIPSSTAVSREHFGWDEYNDWWYYEQRWKLKNSDKQMTDNGRMKPFVHYAQDIQSFTKKINFDTFKTIQRPIYLLTNNSFLSYYQSVIHSLKTNRAQLFVINENSGTIFTNHHSNLIKYSFDEYEFIMNTAFYINRGSIETVYDLNIPNIQLKDILTHLHKKSQPTDLNNHFSFDILAKKYKSTQQEISKEEKILGIIKTWTIVKYFYAHPNRCSIDWENSLEKYLEKAQNTRNSKEYYTLIQEMMATLNDSHVSTYHPSIMDFSKIFVAPISFEYIEDKVIITAIDSSIQANLNIGDEIVSIDGIMIHDILENERQKISSSNDQGLIATVINPGYFIGASGSMMNLGIKKGKEIITVETPRTKYIFQFMGFGDHSIESNIDENHIGYLNLSQLSDANALERELIKMKSTEALIIDLRNSYPTADFNHFLQLLCNKKSKLRIDEVPIVSAHLKDKKQIQISEHIIVPDTSFTYHQPIIVLIDKTMISRPEDIAIALESFPNVRFVGEQTQGTDGEMTKIHLPNGGETSFTGQVVKFGNGANFQGIGILPNLKVDRTIQGIKDDRDEILERALQLLSITEDRDSLY